MARTVAELPKGSRITDYISLGVLNTMIPRTAVDAALEASSRQSIRQRDLPAHMMVYYVIALALYMQSSLSYVHAVRVIRRDIITHGAVPPSTPSQVPPTGAR